MGMDAAETPLSNCVSATETRQAYLNLVAARLCGDGHPCLADACAACGPLIFLIDVRSDECDQRGCTPSSCVYDAEPPS
jgi:hypothetical protein